LIKHLPVTATYFNTVNTAHPTAIVSKSQPLHHQYPGFRKKLGAPLNDHIFCKAG